MSEYEIDVLANTLAGSIVGCGAGLIGCGFGATTAGLSSIIIGTNDASPSQSAYVDAMTSSAVNPSGTTSNVVNAVASSTIANVLPDGDPTGQASLAGAVAGGVVAGLPGYLGGAAYPWLVKLIKQILLDANKRNCECQK